MCCFCWAYSKKTGKSYVLAEEKIKLKKQALNQRYASTNNLLKARAIFAITSFVGVIGVIYSVALYALLQGASLFTKDPTTKASLKSQANLYLYANVKVTQAAFRAIRTPKIMLDPYTDGRTLLNYAVELVSKPKKTKKRSTNQNLFQKIHSLFSRGITFIKSIGDVKNFSNFIHTFRMSPQGFYINCKIFKNSPIDERSFPTIENGVVYLPLYGEKTPADQLYISVIQTVFKWVNLNKKEERASVQNKHTYIDSKLKKSIGKSLAASFLIHDVTKNFGLSTFTKKFDIKQYKNKYGLFNPLEVKEKLETLFEKLPEEITDCMIYALDETFKGPKLLKYYT